MNPVYPGKDVTYIDTKQAQRDAEIAMLDAERLATAAWLAGAAYPAASLDKAWRQLVFGAHHDAITGTEGDQVYLDLLAGWREAFERGDQARKQAIEHLAGLADTASAAGGQAGAVGPAEPAPTQVTAGEGPGRGAAWTDGRVCQGGGGARQSARGRPGGAGMGPGSAATGPTAQSRCGPWLSSIRWPGRGRAARITLRYDEGAAADFG